MVLDETFDTPVMDPRLQWLNPPQEWSIDAASSSLILKPDPDTDFWQKTHYGFATDSGHFLFAAVSGNLILTTRLRFHPVHQYDQAGLMIRSSAECWLKTSVEYEPDGPSKLGVVVTNHGYSDWSLQDFSSERNELWLRVRRVDGDCLVEFSETGAIWTLIRIAHMHGVEKQTSLACGLYACSPRGAGYRAEFDLLKIEALDSHDAASVSS